VAKKQWAASIRGKTVELPGSQHMRAWQIAREAVITVLFETSDEAT
jgi:hypothetical protein